MRAAEPHRHAETLGGSDHDIRPHVTRRPQRHQRQDVRGDAQQPTVLLHGGCYGREVAHGAGTAGVTDQGPEALGHLAIAEIAYVQGDPDRFGPRRQHR